MGRRPFVVLFLTLALVGLLNSSRPPTSDNLAIEVSERTFRKGVSPNEHGHHAGANFTTSALLNLSAEEKGGEEQEEPEEAGDAASSMWLNLLMSVLWPHANSAIQHSLQTAVVPEINNQLQGLLKALVGKIDISGDLGPVSPVFTDIVVVKAAAVEGGGIPFAKLKVGVEWIPEGQSLELKVRGASIIVKDIKFRGDIVLRLDQLLNQFPLIGGISVHFLDQPEVDFDLEGIAAIGDWPIIRKVVRKAIDTVIASRLVMPNHLVIPLGMGVAGFDLESCVHPPPHGLLTVTLLKARGLRDTDGMFAGKSDPYAEIKVGPTTWESARVDGSSNPNWSGQSHSFIVWGDQKVEIKLWDWDLGRDDKLGHIEGLTVLKALNTRRLRDIGDEASSEQTLPLVHQGGAAGTVTLKFEFTRAIPASTSPGNLKGNVIVAALSEGCA